MAASSIASAQSLSLFEPTQSDTVREAPMGRQAAAPVAAAMEGPAALTLRSNNRFGDTYHTVLVDSAGNALELQWRSGQLVAVPMNAGYTVLEVSGAQVTVQYPAGMPCQPNEAVGVSCVGPDTARLSLATLSPVSPRPATSPEAVTGPQPMEQAFGEAVPAEGGPMFINPFNGAVMGPEQLIPEQMQARDERAQARAQRLQQFQIERIPDDQIPPGMRVVRTPFGDRLVPVRE